VAVLEKESTMESRPLTLAAWLRAALGQQERSAPTLARRVGRSTLMVQGWLLGTTTPTEDEQLAIADALGIVIGRRYPGPVRA
jgi:hypothetical protein